MVLWSQKTTPAFFVRSCRASRAGRCLRPPVPTAQSLTSIWRHGSVASSPMWRTRLLQISTSGLEHLAASIWTLKRRPSICRLEANEENTAMKQNEKSKVGRRDFLRAMGAGAGLAVTAGAPLATEAAAAESDADKKKARYQANSADVQTFYKVNRYPS